MDTVPVAEAGAAGGRERARAPARTIVAHGESVFIAVFSLFLF